MFPSNTLEILWELGTAKDAREEFNRVFQQKGEPEDVPERVAVMRQSAEDSGRDPDDIVLTANSVVVSGHTDAEITSNLERMDDTGRTGAEVRESWEGRGLKFRTWEEHKDRFGRYEEAGVSRVYLQLVTRVPEMAEEALDNLRGA